MFKSIFFLPILSIGCTSLSGDWQGEITCEESEPVDIGFTLEQLEGQIYGGDGEAGDQGAECELLFTVEIEKEQLTGDQDLDISFSDCTVVCGGASESLACGDADGGNWDGEDTISWGEDNCDIELTRD